LDLADHFSLQALDRLAPCSATQNAGSKSTAERLAISCQSAARSGQSGSSSSNPIYASLTFSNCFHETAGVRSLNIEGQRAVMVGTTLNFAAALAGLIAAWRWYQTTTIRPPTELPYGGPTAIDTGPLVAFIGEIARLNRRAASWTAFAALLEGLATIAHYYGR
jgi:hypothetical protein